MSLNLSPIGNTQQVDASGVPVSGGHIYTYLAGTTTPVTTYKDIAGATPQTNPIILDALGIPANPIWLQSGNAYKFTFTDAADVPIRTVDNISGVGDTSFTVAQWIVSGLTPTYISGTSFSVVGDHTDPLTQVGRRLQFVVTAGVCYGSVTSTSYGGGLTTVVMSMDNLSLDAGLSAFNVSIITATNSSIPSILNSVRSIPGPVTTATQAVNDSSTKIATTAFVNPASSIGASGYAKLANGLIKQWATVTSSAGGDVNWTLPIPFPTAFYGATGTYINGAGSANVLIAVGANTLSAVNVGAFTANTGSRVAGSCFMVALGK